jgi:nitrogen fixation NifU-like protein
MTRMLQDLYPPLVLEHARHPRNCRVPLHYDHVACGDDPLCGDQISVYLCIDSSQVRDIAFDGTACAIAMASASLMTESLLGRDISEVRRLHAAFLLMLEGNTEVEGLGVLAVFGTIAATRSRERCASLAWQALHAALDAATIKNKHQDEIA